MISQYKLSTSSVNKILIIKYILLLIIILGFLTIAKHSLAYGPCASANIRWSGSSNRVYVSGDVECTLTDIKTLGSSLIPITLVDSAGKIWFSKANIIIEEGAKLTLRSSLYGGDVNELRLKSNNSSDTNSYVEIKADWGALDINGVKITSWNEVVSGPDTEYETYKRAFIRVRSKMDSDGVTPRESRMDVKNSDIGYLGFYASESYGLTWKVVGSLSVFDLVNVYGDVEKNKIHHNYFGIYTHGAEAMKFLENEVYDNIKYGIDTHDDSDNLLIDKNDVHHNGNHGIICSKRCNDLTITNNESYYNTGNGIMLHRYTNNSLVKDNNVHNNTDSGIAIFDSHSNEIISNISKYNSNGLRTSVGSSENVVENNIFSENTKYGMYFYKGSDAPTSGDGRPKLNTFKNNEIKSNAKESIKLFQSDSNTFESNDIMDNGSYAVYLNDSNTNLFINNIATGNVLNYYYLKIDSVNTIKDTDSFSVKIGDTPSIMYIIGSENTIFSNTKSLLTKISPDESSIELNKTNAGSSIIGFTALSFTATPSTGSVNIKPVTWNTSGDFYKKWTAKNDSGTSIKISYLVGDLALSTDYKVVLNGTTLDTFTSDASGIISFDYTGVFSTTKTFEVKVP